MGTSVGDDFKFTTLEQCKQFAIYLEVPQYIELLESDFRNSKGKLVTEPVKIEFFNQLSRRPEFKNDFERWLEIYKTRLTAQAESSETTTAGLEQRKDDARVGASIDLHPLQLRGILHQERRRLIEEYIKLVDQVVLDKVAINEKKQEILNFCQQAFGNSDFTLADFNDMILKEREARSTSPKSTASSGVSLVDTFQQDPDIYGPYVTEEGTSRPPSPEREPEDIRLPRIPDKRVVSAHRPEIAPSEDKDLAGSAPPSRTVKQYAPLIPVRHIRQTPEKNVRRSDERSKEVTKRSTGLPPLGQTSKLEGTDTPDGTDQGPTQGSKRKR